MWRGLILLSVQHPHLNELWGTYWSCCDKTHFLFCRFSEMALFQFYNVQKNYLHFWFLTLYLNICLFSQLLITGSYTEGQYTVVTVMLFADCFLLVIRFPSTSQKSSFVLYHIARPCVSLNIKSSLLRLPAVDWWISIRVHAVTGHHDKKSLYQMPSKDTSRWKHLHNSHVSCILISMLID